MSDPDRIEGSPRISSAELEKKVQDLMGRMVRTRTTSSRRTGIVMLVVSGGLFSLAFLTNSLLLEVTSLTAFIFGALLSISSFEQKVLYYPSALAMAGPMRVAMEDLKAKGWVGNANFEPTKGGVVMWPESTRPGFVPLEAKPFGHDLVAYFESEMGGLDNAGVEFVRKRLPQILSDSTGFAERVTISRDGGEVKTSLVRPFVRPLCSDLYFSENICNTVGCPLVNSVGEALSKSNGKRVIHLRCTYDPITQTATAVHRLS